MRVHLPLNIFCSILIDDFNMQEVNGNNKLFSLNNDKCVEVNDFNKTFPQNIFYTCIKNAQKTLSSLERSLKKTSKYEQKLVQCKKSHNHSHNTHKWWDGIPSATNSSSLSQRGVGKAESLSTMSIICLQYKYEELSKRYEALLKAYDDQCRALCVRDMRLAQWRQQENLTHAELAHAHKSIIAIGEKYLKLKRKRNALKGLYEELLNRMKDNLLDVVEVTAREVLRIDTKLSYCMSAERSLDATLLLYEIRKCNFLFLENIRLKTIIEELLPGQVNWK